LLKTLSVMAAIAVVGVAYFHFKLGLGWIQATYEVVITLSTVGYQRPAVELATEDMAFLAVLIPGGVGTGAYAASLMVSQIVEGDLAQHLGFRKMTKQIGALHGHVVVCGMGSIGRLAARELKEAGREVVCVDRDPALLADLRDDGFMTIEGDATDENVLGQAGVPVAEVLVAAMQNDAESVFLTLSARFLNGRIRVVARGSDERVERKLRRAGANRVILPTILGGRRLAQAVTQPNVLDFVDLMTSRGEHSLRMDEVRIANSCRFVGQTIQGSSFRQRFGVIIVAVRSPDGAMRFNPSDELVCGAGDILVALGEAADLDRLKSEASDTA
jgi:voltage-gated potassium channel